VSVGWEWWGSGVPYGEAWERQRQRREAVTEGRAPGCLALLEHAPVITTGRRPAPGTPDAAALAALGIERFETDRGGLATYHGPGQLVGYAVVSLAAVGFGVRDFVCALEWGVIDWLAARGIEAGRRPGLPGIWVGRDKICAVGLNVSRGVTTHGFALNLSPDLSAFGLFVPCGVTDGGVTSLARLTGERAAPEAAAPSVAESVIRRLDARSRGG
jgi:lipoyl(octanoyl) transferase